MYYKVLKNNKIIDVLDKLIYLKYQPRHKIMILCDETDAQAILSSDMNTIWHEHSLYDIPVDGYDTVSLEEIDKYEYNQLKILKGKTPEEIIDAYTLSLVKEGVTQLVESLKRLYTSNQIDNAHIINMNKDGVIKDKEKNYILGKEE